VLARVETRSDAAPVDLRELVTERAAAWAARAADLGVQLVAETEQGGTVRASREGLRQVLDNLLENALEAAPAGSAVAVVASQRELRVRDQGPGLSPAQRERAFDRFWRARPGAGSGLGLAIVLRLVEADGGQVALRPAADGGLEAVVSLPAA
jgi:signal transduction histidine kinase